MLPRLANPYSSRTDFAQLARDVPAFAAFLQDGHAGWSTIDFQDDAAIRALTAALLERDFHLRIELPSDRLCPTIPSRLEYVLFVLRLALITSDRSSPASFVGLDMRVLSRHIPSGPTH
ncbi:ribosomal RNA large subunit methyltransferase F [Rhodotorula toruloides]|uniref:Ribosomal RNA large subunit methyltransferase F n=1 Tax=Rhodotorula toruloides TaxID=5286 RepID=A0A511KM16_RHOTO|nr:ribosomal RNA large subunit methyltransferase F [Rhodotorula toruloides]